jgi:hypothetical protein
MPPERRDSLASSPRRSPTLPPNSSPPGQPDLFRSALVNLVDRCHPLLRLAGLIDWDRFATAFGPLSRDGVGRPRLPMDGLLDDAVCARFLDSPHVQLFCGESHVQHALPLDRSSMTRWRRRIGAEPKGCRKLQDLPGRPRTLRRQRRRKCLGSSARLGNPDRQARAIASR